MRSFLAKHQYLVIWVAGLVIVGALTVLILQLNQSFLPTAPGINQPTLPAQPPAPDVTLTIQDSGKQNTLMIQWHNLPNGTRELYIFRGKGNDTSTWELWKTIIIGQDQLGSGNAQFILGSGDLGYQYYVQAVGGDGNSTSTLWQGGSGSPGSGDGGGDQGGGGGGSGGGGDQGGGGGGGQQGGGGGNSSGTGGGGDGSGGGGGGDQGGGSGGGGTGGGGNGGGGNGNPYYNPQIQITGYGTANGSFWVEHVNQSIEIGWQDLPVGVDAIVISRSQDQDGPWDQVLAQNNPGPSGTYSLQLVDGTLGDPYYYEMTAFNGTTTVGVYGPIYLPPVGQ